MCIHYDIIINVFFFNNTKTSERNNIPTTQTKKLKNNRNVKLLRSKYLIPNTIIIEKT